MLQYLPKYRPALWKMFGLTFCAAVPLIFHINTCSPKFASTKFLSISYVFSCTKNIASFRSIIYYTIPLPHDDGHNKFEKSYINSAYYICIIRFYILNSTESILDNPASTLAGQQVSARLLCWHRYWKVSKCIRGCSIKIRFF